jgi:hypothetical protein
MTRGAKRRVVLGEPRSSAPPQRWRRRLDYALAMRHLSDGPFRKGEAVWVTEPNGGQRAAEFVGDAESGTWFGGAARAFVLYLDTTSTEAVELDRILAREA